MSRDLVTQQSVPALAEGGRQVPKAVMRAVRRLSIEFIGDRSDEDIIDLTENYLDAVEGFAEQDVVAALKQLRLENPSHPFPPRSHDIHAACKRIQGDRLMEETKAECLGFSLAEWNNAIRNWHSGPLEFGNGRQIDPFAPDFQLPELIRKRSGYHSANFRDRLAAAKAAAARIVASL